MSSARSTVTGRQSLLPSRQLLIWLTTCAASALFVALKPTLQAFALDTFITLTLLLERGQRAARPLYVEYPACHFCSTDSLVIDAWTAQISMAISAKFYHPSEPSTGPLSTSQTDCCHCVSLSCSCSFGYHNCIADASTICLHASYSIVWLVGHHLCEPVHHCGHTGTRGLWQSQAGAEQPGHEPVCCQAAEQGIPHAP